jgi:prevent-host-death family protein
MKSININQLQDQASKVIRDVEDGGIIEVVRYSKPVAYLVGTKTFEEMAEKTNCKECVSDLRKIANKIK